MTRYRVTVTNYGDPITNYGDIAAGRSAIECTIIVIPLRALTE